MTQIITLIFPFYSTRNNYHNKLLLLFLLIANSYLELMMCQAVKQECYIITLFMSHNKSMRWSSIILILLIRKLKHVKSNSPKVIQLESGKFKIQTQVWLTLEPVILITVRTENTNSENIHPFAYWGLGISDSIITPSPTLDKNTL